jgi:Ca2+-binding RTX toxin-like protein
VSNTAYFVVSGQSLTDAWFHQEGVLAAFRAEFLRHNPQYSDVQCFDAARGGSAILCASAELTYSQNAVDATRSNHWYDEATGGDGPNFDLFAGSLATWARDKTVLGVIWDQGQADTQYVTTAERAADYGTGLDHVLQRLMALCGATRTHIQGVGDRAYHNPALHGGADLIHQIQQDFDRVHDYAQLVSNTYDLALQDTVHLTTASSIIAAQRMAAAISTGITAPVLDQAFMAGDGRIYLGFALQRGQTLDDLPALNGFRWNGQAVQSATLDKVAGLVVITPLAAADHGVLHYASAAYSFAMGPGDLLLANGPTGGLPVQPFTVWADRTTITVTPRAGVAGGYSLTGDLGPDSLTGFDGSDSLFGRDGDDLLDGDRGRDRLYGGSGADTFVFKAKMSVDKIYDFDLATDLIALVGFTLDDLRITRYATHSTDIRGPDGERVTLANILPDRLTLDHFVMVSAADLPSLPL